MAHPVTSEQLLTHLKTGNPVKIKIFIFGENIGNDVAFMDHYLCAKKLFPNLTLSLRRSNVDDCSCMGYGNYKGKVILPVDDMEEAVVSQRYPDGSDWYTKFNHGDFSIFTNEFMSMDGYDYALCIGAASGSIWTQHLPDTCGWLKEGVLKEAIVEYNKETNILPEITTTRSDIGDWIDKGITDWTWVRTSLERLCFHDPMYPFIFTEEFKKEMNVEQYRDYMFVSLREPDHVRWHYSVDRQYEILFETIKKIKDTGKPVKIVYSLKDGEIDNNFNLRQSIQRLKAVQDAADDVIFTYVWTAKARRGRPTEPQELDKLARAGIVKVKRSNTIWEELMIASHCKMLLAEPAGFMEAVTLIRKDEGSFSFQTAAVQALLYTSVNKDGIPFALKANKIVIDQSYIRTPIYTNQQLTDWFFKYKNIEKVIHVHPVSHDVKAFRIEQTGIFAQMYAATKNDLISALVEYYTR